VAEQVKRLKLGLD